MSGIRSGIRRGIGGTITVGLGIALALMGGRVQALPGQTLEEAKAWIQSNQTLRPARGETLLVRKSNTPAQRFTFQASLLKVGKLTPGDQGGRIRTEEISLFDMINGVSRERLEESLRVIYGPGVYQDYAQARVVYAYPERATSPADLQGEVREGDRYGYWLEITRQSNGKAYIGRMVVFLRDDLPKLEAELRQRNS